MSNTRKYAEQQPRDGEPVLHCGHIEKGIKHHFMLCPEYLDFARPDGTKGRARWVIQCESCFSLMSRRGPAINGDTEWRGDEPIIEVSA